MIPPGARVWIAMGHTDMRKGMQGLALLVQQSLGRDPFGGDLFVFRGRAGSLTKIIWHDGIGMSLYAKRLEKGRFIWPSAKDGIVSLTSLPNWPVCLTVSTGVTRSIAGGRRARDNFARDDVFRLDWRGRW
jgi:transposase